MKTSKLLLVASLAALGLSQFASAQTAIYISGAPATRKIWNIAIQDLLAANTTGGLSALSEYWTGSTTGTSGYASANQTVIAGGTIDGQPVTIYTDWSGSTGGNQSLALNPPGSNSALKINFLSPNQLTSGTGSGYTLVTGTNLQYPNINLSDTQQSTVPFNGTTTVTNPSTSYSPLTEASPVSPAVTGFEFLTNKNAPADLTNVTTNAAQELFTQGETGLALFTGSSADESIPVYGVGRDISSGARYILLAETGIGVANSDNLYQYEPVVTTGTITNANIPASSGTINLISFPSGAGGYSSFSNVLTVLEATSNNTTGWVITYVTDSDATTAVSNGARALTWNGEVYSPTAIEQGQYDFWSFLHVYYNSSNTTSLNTYIANALSEQIATDTATGALLSTNLQVTRQLDGGLIIPNY